MRSLLLICATAGAALCAPLMSAEGPWQSNDQSAVRLVTPYEKASGEGEFWFGVEFELAPHWHVYWANSGDAGYPPELDLSATPEVSSAELLFPAPERFHLPGGLLAFGYEDSVIYPVRATLEATGDTLELAVNVDYVVCEVECIPYNYDLTLTQPLGELVADPAQAERMDEWRGRIPTSGADLAARIEVEDGQQQGRIKIDLPLAANDLFFLPQDVLILGEPSILPTADGSRAELTASRLDVGKALPENVELDWTATANEGSEGFPGQTGTLVLTTPVAWQGDAEEEATTDAASSPGSGSLWWYWLPVVLASVALLASGAIKASPAVLRTAWIAGIFAVGAGWYLVSRMVANGGSLVSMPVVAVGTWLLVLGAVAAFAVATGRGGASLALVSGAATFSLLPAAPGIGWVGAVLLVLAVIASRPQAETPSRTLLGLAGFLALLGVVGRFYLLSGSVPPTPLAGMQIGILTAAAGSWMAFHGARTSSRGFGWGLVVAGAACVLYFVG